MPLRLSELDIRILEVIKEKEKTYYEEIRRELGFEFPHANWNNCFSLLLQKKYIQDVADPGYGGFIELTDDGEKILADRITPVRPTHNLRESFRPVRYPSINTSVDKPIRTKKVFQKFISWIISHIIELIIATAATIIATLILRHYHII